MSDSQPITVHIYNQAYTLGSDEHDPEYVRRAAAYLDSRMHEAAANADKRSPLDIAILASLEVAAEVLQVRRRQEAMLGDADRRLSRFTELLRDGDPLQRDDASPDTPQQD